MQPDQSSIDKLVSCLTNLSNKLQISETTDFKTDPRYRFARMCIPTITQHSNEVQEIKKFMGSLCKKVFEHAFAELVSKKLENDQVKIYCSENIIYSTVLFIK